MLYWKYKRLCSMYSCYLWTQFLPFQCLDTIHSKIVYCTSILEFITDTGFYRGKVQSIKLVIGQKVKFIGITSISMDGSLAFRCSTYFLYISVHRVGRFFTQMLLILLFTVILWWIVKTPFSKEIQILLCKSQ